MKKYKLSALFASIILGVMLVNTVYGEESSDVKYKDSYLESMDLGDKVCYYCVFSSNEDVKVSIDDITYKGNSVSGVQNYRLDNLPKLKEKDNNTYDRYNVEDNEYAFVKFRDISENDKKIYIYFAQLPAGTKQDRFLEQKYIVSVGNPTFNDFENTDNVTKFKYYDGTYAEGWTVIDGNTFYFDTENNEAYKEAWLHDEANDEWYYFGQDGILVTGLQEIKGSKYWFSDNGKMLVNTTAPDGTTIDENGVYIEETESQSEEENEEE